MIPFEYLGKELLQIMTWHRMGDKPKYEPVMIQFISSQTLLGLDALTMYMYVLPVLSLAGSELWS